MRAINNGKCDEENNNKECNYDGGDCCRYSCEVKNGQFVELDDDGKLVPAHKCDSVVDSETCLDPVLKGYKVPLDYSAPVLNTDKEHESDGTNDDYETCSSIYKDAVAAGFKYCNDDTFKRFAIDCKEHFEEIRKDAGVNLPRCPPRTKQGCRCRESWTYKIKKNEWSFENQACGNPKNQHKNDWCKVVDGSCNTKSGNPENGGNWDDCLTGLKENGQWERVLGEEENLQDVDCAEIPGKETCDGVCTGGSKPNRKCYDAMKAVSPSQACECGLGPITPPGPACGKAGKNKKKCKKLGKACVFDKKKKQCLLKKQQNNDNGGNDENDVVVCKIKKKPSKKNCKKFGCVFKKNGKQKLCVQKAN